MNFQTIYTNLIYDCHWKRNTSIESMFNITAESVRICQILSIDTEQGRIVGDISNWRMNSSLLLPFKQQTHKV